MYAKNVCALASSLTLRVWYSLLNCESCVFARCMMSACCHDWTNRTNEQPKRKPIFINAQLFYWVVELTRDIVYTYTVIIMSITGMSECACVLGDTTAVFVYPIAKARKDKDKNVVWCVLWPVDTLWILFEFFFLSPIPCKEKKYRSIEKIALYIIRAESGNVSNKSSKLHTHSLVRYQNSNRSTQSAMRPTRSISCVCVLRNIQCPHNNLKVKAANTLCVRNHSILCTWREME